MNIFTKIYYTQVYVIKKILFFIPYAFVRIFAKILALCFMLVEFLLVFVFITLIGLIIFLQSEYGTNWITKNTQEILVFANSKIKNGMRIEVGSLSLEEGIQIQDVRLYDTVGLWLEVGSTYVDIAPSDLIYAFSTLSIPEILIENVSYYRNPQTIRKDPIKTWKIPNVVVPLPLGTFVFENIVLKNIFFSADAMSLSDYNLDLQADAYVSATLNRKEAFISIKVKEKNANLTGNVVYTPRKAVVNLEAEDFIWAKTFAKTDKAFIKAQGTLEAKEFPMSKAAPFTIELQGRVDFQDISFFSENNQQVEFQSSFLFDYENAVFTNSTVHNQNFKIDVPYFGINVRNKVFHDSSGHATLYNAAMIHDTLFGSASGDILFSGNLENIALSGTFTSPEWGVQIPIDNKEILKFSSNTITTNLHILKKEQKPYLIGSVAFDSPLLAFYDSLITSPVQLNGDWSFYENTVLGENIFLTLQGVTSQIEGGVYLENMLEKKSQYPPLAFHLAADFQNMNLFADIFPLLGKGNLDLSTYYNKTQDMVIKGNFTDLSLNGLSLSSLNGEGKLEDFYQFFESKIPKFNLKAQLGTATLNSQNLEEENVSSQILWENGTLEAEVINSLFSFEGKTQGKLISDFRGSLDPFESKGEIKSFALTYSPFSQTISTDQAFAFNYKEGFVLDGLFLQWKDKEETGKVELSASYSPQALALKGNAEIPLMLLNPYVEAQVPAGNIFTSFELAATQNSQKGFIDLKVDNLKILKNLDFVLEAKGNLTSNALEVEATFGTAQITELTAKGILPIQFKPLPDFSLNQKVEFQGDWKGNISSFWQFLPLPGRYLKGNGMFSFDLTGTLQEPEIKAVAYLSKARYEDEILNFVIADINLEAEVTPKNTVLRLSATDGRPKNPSNPKAGTLVANGTLNTEDRSSPNLILQGAVYAFSPLKRDDIDIRFSGTVNALGALMSPTVFGALEIDYGQYNLLGFGGSSIASLTDVQVLDEKSSLDSELTEKLNFSPLLQVSLVIPKSFYVKGMGLDSEWKGNLQVMGTLFSPQIYGTLEPVKGSFDLLEKKFQIGRSLVIFTGNMLTPVYNVTLQRQNSAIDTLITVTGTGTSMQMDLSSVPQLPADEIMARTLYGKPLSQLSRFEAIQAAAAAAILLSSEFNKLDLFGATRKMLGLDVLRIGTSDSTNNNEDDLDTATIEAGGYLNEKIYLGVEQGLQETAVKIEIELLPNINVEARVGTESSNAGVTWKRDY